MSHGAEDWKVDEHLGDVKDAVLVVEFEAWPEPKALLPSELADLIEVYGGFTQAARKIGDVSEGFVRQNTKPSKRAVLKTRNNA